MSAGLRPYQEDANAAVMAQYAKGQNRLLIKLPTGTGKTRTTAAFFARADVNIWKSTLPKAAQRVLWIAHREELLEQALETIQHLNPGILASIEQADRHANVNSDVVVASIQSLAGREPKPFHRLKRLLRQGHFGIVVIDECFPAGTLIDGRPIETINIGDHVDTWDADERAIVSRRVLRVMRRPSPDTLVRFTTADSGSVTATVNHPIWTRDGWKSAAILRRGDMVLRSIHHEKGHSVQPMQGGDRSVVAGWNGLLRYLSSRSAGGAAQACRLAVHGMRSIGRVLGDAGARKCQTWPSLLLGRAYVSAAIARIGYADGGHESPIRIGQDEATQSHEEPGVEGQGTRHTIGTRTVEASTPWRGYTEAYDPAITPRGSLGLGDGGRRRPMADRHRGPSEEDCGRSRRPNASGIESEGARREKTGGPYWTRVESVEVLESGSNGGPGSVCRDGQVYNLEVEDTHTYFANGILVSNCHHAASPTYRNALVHLGFLPASDLSDKDDIEAASFDDVAKMEAALAGWDVIAPKDRLLIGLTATPNRSDAIGLGCVIQSIAYSYGLKDAINDQWLVPIRPIVVESGESLDNVKTTAGDFNQKDLAAAVNTERRTQLAVAAWLEHAKDRPTLAFTVDVAHALAVAYAFRQAGVAAMPISGVTPKDERRELLRRFKAGEVQMLCNAMLLTEGTDLPPTSCILHLKPTKSATLYEQMTGRGLRLSPGTGKTDCIVIDLVDIAKRHSLQACPVLYGLPPGIKTTGQDLRSTETDFEALRAKYPHLDIESAINGGRMTLAELGAKVATFDVWTVPTLGEIAWETTQNWLKIGESYRLQYPWLDGSEVLTVLRDLIGKWEVSSTFRPKDGPVRQRTLVSALETSVAAIKHADQFVSTQRSVASRLTDKNASWRTGPASEAQMGLLNLYRVPYNRKELLGHGGKGKASDLIGMAKARGGR